MTKVEMLATRLVSFYDRQQCEMRATWHLRGDPPPSWLKLALPGIFTQSWCHNFLPKLDDFDTPVYDGLGFPVLGELDAGRDIWGVIQFKSTRSEHLVAIPRYSERGCELVVEQDGTAEAPKPYMWPRSLEQELLLIEDRRNMRPTWYASLIHLYRVSGNLAKTGDARLASLLRASFPKWCERHSHFRDRVIYGGKMDEDKDIVATKLKEMFPLLRVVEITISDNLT